MPGKGKSRAKQLAQQQCTECIHPDHLVYADQKARVIFRGDVHKKYNAAIYFQEDSCRPMEDAIQVPPGQRHLGAEAYNNFVTALEIVNQQEYVIADHTKAPKNPQDKQRVLDIAQEQLGVGAVGLDGQEWTPKQLAAWERDIKLRVNKTKAESYRTRLIQRSKYLPEDHLRIADEVPGPERWGNCKHPPIRKETAELLCQPPEVDFSFVGSLLFLVAMFSYAWNLYGQIDAITTVCSASYICPGGDRHNLPIPAPPANFRRSSGYYFSSVDTGSFWPSKKQPCVFGTEGCKRPGYMIQWPYVQIDGNASRLSEVPTAIKGVCPLVIGGDKGWVFDPFSRRLRSEYYDCSLGAIADEKYFPMQVGTASLWFDKKFYQENNKATLECMMKAKEDGSVSVTDSLSSWSLLSPAALSNAEEIVGGCVESSEYLIGLGDKCACHEDNWDNWPFNDFHPSTLAGVRTKTCDGGSRSGLICTSDATCAGFTCVDTFDNQVSISQSAKYGCYFEGPDATVQQSAEVTVCGSNFWTGSSTQSKSPNARQQAAVWSFWAPHISTRTMLLIVFAIKEGSLITAAVVWGVLRVATGILYLLLVLLLSPLFLYIQAAGDRKLGRFVVSVFDQIDTIVQTQLDIVWRLCINLSTAYRIYGLVSALAHRQVNASIKDLDTKLTSVANLLYTLMLIFVRGGTPDATLVSGTALSLFTLLHKMNGESLLLSKLAKGFQDLNENRLTKFELALFLVKAMEKFLSSDVQYNWVEQLVGEPDFTPDVHEEAFVHPRALDEDPDDYINQPMFLASPQDASPLMEVDDFSEENVKEAVKAEHSRELMSLKHAKKFGHDGLGQFRRRYVKDKAQYNRGLTATSESKVVRSSASLAFLSLPKPGASRAAIRSTPGPPVRHQQPQQAGWGQTAANFASNPAEAFSQGALAFVNVFAEPPAWAQQQQNEAVKAQSQSPGPGARIPTGPNARQGNQHFQMSGVA